MNGHSESTASFEAEALPHLDTLYRVALRLTGEHSRAEDLVQETTILRNTFINEYRKQKREPTPIDFDAVDPMAIYHAVRDSDPEGEFFSHIIDDRVWAAIDALPEEFREVVVLSDAEELPYGEIARLLGIPMGTVKSRLFRGRRLLQQVLYEHAVEMGYVRAREDV
jgi:RNA polymerase sigma-70 factor (ECF subfamily)